MEIREAYKREFLITLQESPAWDLFVSSILKGMHFIQDDVKFTMGNVPRVVNLTPQYLDEYKTFLQQDEIVKVTLDIVGVKIKVTNCKVSNDGIKWSDFDTVTGEFYIKSLQYQELKNINIICLDFYPDMVSCNDVKMLLNVFGLDRDDVEFSSFDVMLTATSPYLVNYILKRINIPYNMEYFFDNGSEVEVTGSKLETVRDGITIQRVGGDMFYYDSYMTLIQNKDYIKTDSGTYKIKSVNRNTLTCDAPEASGTFSVIRREFITPIDNNNKLLSILEFDFNREDADLAERFIKRVTPVRCDQGFKGKVDLRITTNLRVQATCAIPKVNIFSIMKLKEEISLIDNRELRVYLNGLFEDDLRLIDLEYNDYQTDEIVLL